MFLINTYLYTVKIYGMLLSYTLFFSLCLTFHLFSQMSVIQIPVTTMVHAKTMVTAISNAFALDLLKANAVKMVRGHVLLPFQLIKKEKVLKTIIHGFFCF